MSDSPIFDQIVSEFAAKGAVYEEFIKWSTPAFRWTGSEYVVQLDHQTRTGVKLDKPLSAKVLSTWVHSDVLEANGIEVPQITGINDRPELLEEHKEAENATANFGRLIQDYVSQMGQSFAAQHPLAIVTDMHLESNDDGSATVVIEAVQPITSVMPLSERNTAEPME